MLVQGLITNCERIKTGKKNWPKSAKKCQKEPKFVFRARAPLPVCWPEGPAAGATKVRARRARAGCAQVAGRRPASQYYFYLEFKRYWFAQTLYYIKIHFCHISVALRNKGFIIRKSKISWNKNHYITYVVFTSSTPLPMYVLPIQVYTMYF